ncbi:hypothetical protein HN011_012027 [Eciton burchellii]|nr:hypothetical protein HN011_012027 [Eciton burchellii]
MEGSQLRNFKDFLLVFNQISETCFKQCANSFLSRDISRDEESCINNCAQKFIHVNHKIMQIFVEVQPMILSKRMEELNTAQAALETQNQQAESSKAQ